MRFTISNLSGHFDGYKWIEGPIGFEIADGKINSIDTEIEEGDVDGSNMFLAPSFVDGHTHLIFGGDRSFELSMKVAGASYAEILESGGGIHSTVKSTRDATNQELRDLVLQRLDLMMQNGTMTVEAKSGYGLTAEHELRLLQILNEANELHPVEIIPTYCGAHALPSEVSRETYVEIVNSIVPEIKQKGLATSSDVFCDRGAFTVEETEKILKVSEDNNLPIKVHAEELEYTGIGKIAAKDYSALSVDHLLLSDNDDFRTYEQFGSTAMFMPAATIGLFTTQSPQGWQETDVNIGLGSDFNPNNLVVSMQTAIRLAIYLYKMDPMKAFAAAISGSYRGIMGEQLPALSEGANANFNLLSAADINQFSTRFDQNLVKDVYKDGKSVLTKSTHQ